MDTTQLVGKAMTSGLADVCVVWLLAVLLGKRCLVMGAASSTEMLNIHYVGACCFILIKYLLLMCEIKQKKAAKTSRYRVQTP